MTTVWVVVNGILRRLASPPPGPRKVPMCRPRVICRPWGLLSIEIY